MKTRVMVCLFLVSLLISMGVPEIQAASPAEDNTFYGYQAGDSITTGLYNSFYGAYAGLLSTEGEDNTFIGDSAGNDNSTGSYNTFVGSLAGTNNTIAEENTFLGGYAGYSNTTGSQNTFVGNEAGHNSISGLQNTFIGNFAGRSNTFGNFNTFLGNNAGKNNTSAVENTFIGHYAGYSNSTGRFNTFIGSQAGRSNTIAWDNTFIGDYSGYSNTTGGKNTFIGNEAGHDNTSGSLNVFLGNHAGYNETGSNKLYIDNSDTSSPLIYGEFDNDIIAVNGSLGVGTASPVTALEVIGTVTATAFAGDGSGLTNVPADAHIHSGADIASGTVAATYIDSSIARDAEVTSQVDVHATRTDNPHSVSAAQLGAAAASHDHDADYVNVSGGTITGNLLVMGIVDVDSDLYVIGNMYLESDIHAKTNIKPIESSLDKINNIHGVSFA
jgi:hypothetical protein